MTEIGKVAEPDCSKNSPEEQTVTPSVIDRVDEQESESVTTSLVAELINKQKAARATELDTKVIELRKHLPDPRDMFRKFLSIPWYDTKYFGKKIEGYEWYSIPPYIHLFINKKDEIDLQEFTEPTEDIVTSLWRKVYHTDSVREKFLV